MDVSRRVSERRGSCCCVWRGEHENQVGCFRILSLSARNEKSKKASLEASRFLSVGSIALGFSN